MIWDSSAIMTYNATMTSEDSTITTWVVWCEESLWNVGALKEYAFRTFFNITVKVFSLNAVAWGIKRGKFYTA
jgi:hypothetical protein